jgi:glycosyltransferase involved in cell wall biosynthesis
MDVVFLCQLVPDEIERQDVRVSNAAQLYQKKFHEFIQPVTGISIVPNFIDKPINFYDKDSNIHYLNKRRKGIRTLTNITKLTGDTRKALSIIRKHKDAAVWFYNLNISTLFIAMIAKYVLRRKLYIIVADYVVNGTFVQRQVNRMITKFDGAIVLNSNIKVVKNALVMPGLLRDKDILPPLNRNTLSNKVLLSGSLGVTTGLPFTLEFFSKHPMYHLYVTGRPYDYTKEAFQALMDKYAAYPNIHYLGQLSYEQYVATLDECDVALSLRDPKEAEHDYNFPSKILEYLSRNKLVVSSKSYKDLSEGVLFECDRTEDSFRAALERVFSMNETAVEQARKKIYSEVKNNFSRERLLEIVDELSRN